MIEEMLEAVERSIEDVKRKFYGVVTGSVSSVDDPLHLGRVQVKLPFLDDDDNSPWARIAIPFGGLMSGHYFIPDVEDEVLVAFEHGDVTAPYVLGCLWTAFAPPPLQSPQDQIRVMRTQCGNQIVLTERPPSVTLQTGPTAAASIPSTPTSTGAYQTVALDEDGISVMTATKILLRVATNSIEISPEEIKLTVGGNKITLSQSGIEISATGTLEIKASGVCTVKGSLVQIN